MSLAARKDFSIKATMRQHNTINGARTAVHWVHLKRKPSLPLNLRPVHVFSSAVVVLWTKICSIQSQREPTTYFHFCFCYDCAACNLTFVRSDLLWKQVCSYFEPRSRKFLVNMAKFLEVPGSQMWGSAGFLPLNLIYWAFKQFADHIFCSRIVWWAFSTVFWYLIDQIINGFN